MKVLNTKTGIYFPHAEFVPMTDEQYKEYGKNVPTLKEKWFDPVIDRLVIWLYHDRYTLDHCFHYRNNYKCIDPVFIDDNKYYPMRWYFEKSLINFRDTMLPEEFRDGFLDNWQRSIGLALAKLEGKMYFSAGAN